MRSDTPSLPNAFFTCLPGCHTLLDFLYSLWLCLLSHLDWLLISAPDFKCWCPPRAQIWVPFSILSAISPLVIRLVPEYLLYVNDFRVVTSSLGTSALSACLSSTYSGPSLEYPIGVFNLTCSKENFYLP